MIGLARFDAVMRRQMRDDHRQHLMACDQTFRRGGEDLAMPRVKQAGLLGKLARSPVRLAERILSWQPVGLGPGSQTKRESISKSLPGGLFALAVHIHPLVVVARQRGVSGALARFRSQARCHSGR